MRSRVSGTLSVFVAFPKKDRLSGAHFKLTYPLTATHIVAGLKHIIQRTNLYAAVAATIKGWITTRDSGEGRIVPEVPAPRVFVAIHLIMSD